MELKNTITQLENSQERRTGKMDQTEGKTSGPGDKVEELGHTKKEFGKNLKDTEKEQAENVGTVKRPNLPIIIIDEGEDKAQTRSLTRSQKKTSPN